MKNKLKEKIEESKILDINARFFGISNNLLMERAGKGVAEFILKKFKNPQRIAVFCGLGNNGGDGLVTAYYLLKKHQVTVFLIGQPEKIKTKEARKNWQRLKSLKENKNLKLIISPSLKEIKDEFDLVIEALFGVGIKGKLKAPFSSLVKKINRFKAKKIAIDIPAPGFKADYTLSLEIPKTKGALLVDLKIPQWIKKAVGPGDIQTLYQPPPSSHKGENGILMIIAGSEKYHGAPLLATKVASKIVDLIYFFSHPQNQKLLSKMRSKICEFINIREEEIDFYLKKADALLIGPGMEEKKETQELVNYLLKKFPQKKFIIDADALKILNSQFLHSNCLLTPHQGEFKKLFHLAPTFRNVFKMSKKFGCLILLKGKKDLIVSPQNYKINYLGNPGMTKGGTGDVLAGLCAALACKNNLFQAACGGAFLNGLAAERLRKKVDLWFNASDLIEEIPKAYRWAKNF